MQWSSSLYCWNVGVSISSFSDHCSVLASLTIKILVDCHMEQLLNIKSPVYIWKVVLCMYTNLNQWGVVISQSEEILFVNEQSWNLPTNIKKQGWSSVFSLGCMGSGCFLSCNNGTMKWTSQVSLCLHEHRWVDSTCQDNTLITLMMHLFYVVTNDFH